MSTLTERWKVSACGDFFIEELALFNDSIICRSFPLGVGATGLHVGEMDVDNSNTMLTPTDTCTQTARASVYAVKPLYSGHSWDVANWLLYKGSLIIQCTFKREVLFGTLLGGCFREVTFLYRSAIWLLYTGFTVQACTENL